VPDYYEAILNILPSPSCIIPIGDPRFENAARTAVTTKGRGGLDGLAFNYSEARTAWDGKSYRRGRGSVLYQPFNGVDEVAGRTPAVDSWWVDDSGDAGFSMGTWIKPGQLATQMVYLSKQDETGGSEAREWNWRLAGSLSNLLLIDESANVTASRPGATALVVGRWYFLCVTYDGTGGATAANGITHYLNGVADTGAASNNGAYVAMEDLTAAVYLGTQTLNGGGLGRFFNGTMAGGPLGLWFAKHNAAGTPSAQDIRKLHALGLEAQRDLPLLNRMRGMR